VQTELLIVGFLIIIGIGVIIYFLNKKLPSNKDASIIEQKLNEIFPMLSKKAMETIDCNGDQKIRS